ncbi:MAG: thioredoxin family protein [Candidatus Obscuribacterales bacterium]|nr:thioredoxin family protein [Candidatus Obscuribacterales bacterium]
MNKKTFLYFSRLLVLSLLAIAVFALSPSTSQNTPILSRVEAAADESAVKAVLISNCKTIKAGEKFRLGVELNMAPGWHTYYRESGEAGMPTKISFELPDGFKASDLLWERPHKLVDAGIVTYGYNEHTVIAAELQAPADLKAGTELKFQATVKWLACKDACVPGSAKLELTLPVAAEAVADNLEKFAPVNFNGPAKDAISESGAAANNGGSKSEGKKKSPDTESGTLKTESKAASEGILPYLGFAFIGGFILNFMPCVLPVISIKVFSLIQQAGEDKKRVFQHGITFVSGIVLSFLALGLVVIAIQGAGQKIGWGFQFQYPVFVLSMSAVVTLFALSMFGIFYFDLTAGKKSIDELASSEGLVGTFFKGVLATVLSTPCTAPFLGTALGFAFVQPWWQILSIFLVIALGMSSPYFVLALRPDWMKFLPKPGTWMEKFKESMGFLLLATVVWLLSVLGGLVDADALVSAIGFLLALSTAAWIVGGFIDLTSTGKRQAVVWTIALTLCAASYWFLLKPYPELFGTKATIGSQTERNDKNGIQWQEFKQSKLDELLKQKKTVFIDFTAKWCLTCKVNEATIINTPSVIAKFKELNVVPLKADWTAQDAEISDLLRKFGRSGVPVYVVYPAEHPEQPVLLPEALSQDIVLDALSKAGASQ